MRRIFIGMGALMMVLALTATQPVGAGQQQTQGDQLTGGDQGLSGPAIGDDPGIPVQNKQGQDLGRVLALATKNGVAAYLLVAKNGSERELTPIPVSAAQFDPQTNAVILMGVYEKDLALAPTISIDQLERLDDPEFENQVHSYYGQEPGQQGEFGEDMQSEEGMRQQQ
jgi:hypothetical protein